MCQTRARPIRQRGSLVLNKGKSSSRAEERLLLLIRKALSRVFLSLADKHSSAFMFSQKTSWNKPLNHRLLSVSCAVSRKGGGDFKLVMIQSSLILVWSRFGLAALTKFV